jgi:hypothetical protein
MSDNEPMISRSMRRPPNGAVLTTTPTSLAALMPSAVNSYFQASNKATGKPINNVKNTSRPNSPGKTSREMSVSLT